MFQVYCDLDMYMLNAFRIGYELSYRTKIPNDFVGDFYVFETMSLLLPVFRFSLEDIGAVFLDRYYKDQLVVFLSRQQRLFKYWDFVVTSDSGFKSDHWRRPATGVRVIQGIDMLALWLSQCCTRSFSGPKTAQSVAFEAVKDFVQDYRSLGIDFDFVLDVEDSLDLDRYLQSNIPTTRFLYYLRNVAKSSLERDVYFCWFERLVENSRKKLYWKFRRFSSLWNRQPEIVFEYVLDPKKLEKYLSADSSVIPFIAYKIDTRNEGVVLNKKKFKAYKFDLASKKLSSTEYSVVHSEEDDIFTDFLGRFWREKYNIRATMTLDTDLHMRFCRNLYRAGLRKRVWLLCFGNPKLTLGQKVRVIVPTGFSTHIVEALSGDWLLGSIVHFISQDLVWLMKVCLLSPELKPRRIHGRRY